MFKNTDRVMDKLISGGIPGNDIIVYKSGEEVYRSYRGYSNAENKIPMNGNERYNMYSCSKPITATAVMQLIERQKLDLDEPLYTFMPEFKDMYIRNENGVVKAKNHITIKQLLCMTAGFSYDTYSEAIQKAIKDTDGRCPTVETIRYLAEDILLSEPGTKWNYGLCHDVLAAVIAIVSKMSFNDYINKNIFAPLEMNNSTFLMPDSDLATICAQYKMTEKGLENVGKKIQNYKFGTEFESGGAGLISTTEDYIKFLEALRKGDIILKKETIDMMKTDMMQGVDMSACWIEPYSYGLGVRCAPKNNITNITDFGWGGAAGAYLAIDTVKDYTVFYSMHVLNAGDLDGRKEILSAVNSDLKLY